MIPLLPHRRDVERTTFKAPALAFHVRPVPALVRRDGEVVQYVPFRKRAWHAGESNYQGRVACNDFSIGIELEGLDDVPYTDVQYEVLAAVVKVLMGTFPGLSANCLVGHCDIAPQRKTDPGSAFDWQRLRQHLVDAV